MLILRATRKLRQLTPDALDPDTVSDTALGDWYANRLVVDGQPLVLMVSALSLLPMLVRAREVRTLPARLPGIVEQRLSRMAIPSRWLRREVEQMRPVVVAKTVDRSVLGTLVDFAKAIPYHLPEGGWDDGALLRVEDRLGATPCRVVRRWEDVIFPRRKAPELLEAKWSEGDA